MDAQRPQNNLIILINTGSTVPDLADRIRRIAPGAVLLSAEDLGKDPSLLEKVEVVFGRLKPEQFPQARRLCWVQGDSAGMDWAKRPEVRQHPAILTNARIHGIPISEHLFGMLLMLIRGLHLALVNQQRGEWTRPPRHAMGSLWGKTLCVVGLGQIGQRCALLGEAFGMQVIGVRRHPQPTPHVRQTYAAAEMNQALVQADVVMVVLPGTSETHRLVGPDQFRSMKRGALFFNAGRGRTVDTDALVQALREGIVGGAGLDVTDPEPLPPGHPLWSMPNVIITPHYSGLHPQYAQRACELFLQNLRRLLAGEPMQFVVSKEQGY